MERKSRASCSSLHHTTRPAGEIPLVFYDPITNPPRRVGFAAQETALALHFFAVAVQLSAAGERENRFHEMVAIGRLPLRFWRQSRDELTFGRLEHSG